MFIRLLIILAALSFAGVAASQGAGDEAPCRALSTDGANYVVCRFDPAVDNIRLFHAGADGAPYGHFLMLRNALEAKGDVLRFAMNAGMYDEARAPVGLYVEEGAVKKNANTNDGPGNFHLKPNGVFFVAGKSARVMETGAYLESGAAPDYATQSGPMLVIDGDIHPAFRIDSTSRKQRNGVGVTADGEVIFAISDGFVTFHQFASLFRDELKTPNALFLDGGISRLYAPELGRNDAGAAMGPIVGVTVHAD